VVKEEVKTWSFPFLSAADRRCRDLRKKHSLPKDCVCVTCFEERRLMGEKGVKRWGSCEDLKAIELRRGDKIWVKSKNWLMRKGEGVYARLKWNES